MRCFSSRAISVSTEKASKVVMLDGTLREFSRSVTVHHAIEDESDCIIFDTEKLHAGEYILSLEPDTELESGHVYMLLPQSMLHHQLDSADIEELSVKIKEALLMAAVDKKSERSSSFCGLREMLSGQDIGEKINWREVKKEGGDQVTMNKTEGTGMINKAETGIEAKVNKTLLDDGKGNINKRENACEVKKRERKQIKCQYVWYLGFASLPIEDDHENS